MAGCVVGDEAWYQSVLSQWDTTELLYDMDEQSLDPIWVFTPVDQTTDQLIAEHVSDIVMQRQEEENLSMIQEPEVVYSQQIAADNNYSLPSFETAVSNVESGCDDPLLFQDDETAAIIRNAEAVLLQRKRRNKPVSMRSLFSPGPSPLFMPPALEIELQNNSSSLQLYTMTNMRVTSPFKNEHDIQQAFAQDIYVDEARLINAPKYNTNTSINNVYEQRNNLTGRIRFKNGQDSRGFSLTFLLVQRLYLALTENENFHRLFVDCYGFDTVNAILSHLKNACAERFIEGFIYVPSSQHRSCILRDPDAGFNQCIHFKLESNVIVVAHPWRGLPRKCASHGSGARKGSLSYESIYQSTIPVPVMVARHIPLCCHPLPQTDVVEDDGDIFSAPLRPEVRWCPNVATERCQQDIFVAPSLRKATELLYRERHGEVPNNRIRSFMTFLQLTPDRNIATGPFRYYSSGRPLVLLRISVLQALFKAFNIRISDC